MREENSTKDIIIRLAKPEEAIRIAEIEGICFPKEEAASQESIVERMGVFPENFLVAEIDEEVIGFVNGCVTDRPVLGDELYHDAELHKPDGEIQTVFGLAVLPEYQRRGIGAALLRSLSDLSKERGKKAVILTCKDYRIHFYESCGFTNHGKADSCHGGAVWYDMQQWF